MKNSFKWKKDYKYAAVYSENEHDFFIEPDLDDETKIQARDPRTTQNCLDLSGSGQVREFSVLVQTWSEKLKFVWSWSGLVRGLDRTTWS